MQVQEDLQKRFWSHIIKDWYIFSRNAPKLSSLKENVCDHSVPIHRICSEPVKHAIVPKEAGTSIYLWIDKTGMEAISTGLNRDGMHTHFVTADRPRSERIV